MKIDKGLNTESTKENYDDFLSRLTTDERLIKVLSMTNRKYELTDETIIIDGKTLHRIKALRSFGSVVKGELGGFVECEANLSQRGNCWVYNNAKIHNAARVVNNSQIMDNANVCGNAQVYKNAKVMGNANVCENAQVEDNAKLYGNAQVYGNAKVRDNAKVYGDAQVTGNARVCDNAKVMGSAKVCGNVWVMDNANIYDNAKVMGNAEICGNARVMGKAWVMGSAKVHGKAYILHPKDLIVMSSLGSRDEPLTAYRSKLGGVEVATGCFHGTLEEFKEKVKSVHGKNQYGKEYQVAIAFIKKFFSIDRGLD